ncbi:efflux RND transporter permease subunit [Pseudoduganella namucuonensis]|uniref:Cobalt-zinc-cadmium resistance protein CzcA n=1 Tax=Pseudoduganella namucuonensis TaxID=1035707 RepID=A0A1I7HNH6_9BURK|nr:CusA/CzcA family heavy metal efflux RND transporter [Pseudoduganella namucuonensis]SFU62129.1 cobalt-zinc-cadmium resistance protein CzcA [Pseudoduganella namucuonensis]
MSTDSNLFDRLIQFSIRQRWLVMMAVLVMTAVGAFSYTRLSIDAVPDITNVQVQVNTAAPGYSPLEAEQRITFPIETVMAGLPNLEQTRSLSRYGLSQVTVVFKDGTDIHFARQLVNQRVQEARGRLPAGLEPQMGPIATGLGEIYMWTVEAREGALKPDGTPYTPMDLREIQDWVIKPQMRTVPGVTDINPIGGYAKEFQVAPVPGKLVAYGLDIGDVVEALERNNGNVGAGYIERNGEQYLVRAPGQATSIADLANVVISTRAGVPVRVKDVAEVGLGKELRSGAATEDGHEVVLATVFMLVGENSREVSRAVDARLAEVNRSLPKGVQARPVYDRTILVDKAIATVRQNLLEGAALVVAVLFLFLHNFRAALLTAAVIPLSMLFTFSAMAGNGVSANLMSLGALDFGIIVDGAVVIVESCVRRLAHAQAAAGRALTREERYAEVFAAAREARRPLLFGQLIIIVVYLPVFALGGIEGKMFHPMAFTVVAALVGAMILSVTFVPAAVALLLDKPVQERPGRVMEAATSRYVQSLNKAFRHAPAIAAGAAVTVALSVLLAFRLGTEFIPTMDEGDITLHAMRIPGTSLTQAVTMQLELETALKAFPEVSTVFSKLGTAEIASDPMPPSVTDTYVMLKPRDQWPDPRRPKAALVAAMEAVAAKVPGNNYEFTQPIQMRFNELISGVRSDVAVKVFGDDMAAMQDMAERIAEVMEGVPGAADVKFDRTTGLPMLTIRIDREKAARLGLSIGDVQATISTAVGGREAGVMFEGDRRFSIVVRMPEQLRNDPDHIRRLPVRLPAREGAPASYVELGEIAVFDTTPGANQVGRENGKRNVVVTANVRGRDIGSFVAEAERSIRAKVPLPAGYWTTWGGTFEQLQSAGKRLQVVLPLTLLVLAALLFAMFGNLKDGLLVFTGVPFALTGGVLALWLRGLPMSMSAGVGFIALCGVAVLNGLVMISQIRALMAQGMPSGDAVVEGASSRLRPVLMTALVASLGFVPMAIAVGTGAEVQRPLATVVIGGILSSTVLTLFVLPVLARFAYRKARS